jgi:hypothetical protein
LYAEQRRDFPGAAMVGAVAGAKVIAFPQAQRDALDIVALLHEEAGGHGTIDAAAHGDHDLNSSRKHHCLPIKKREA